MFACLNKNRTQRVKDSQLSKHDNFAFVLFALSQSSSIYVRLSVDDAFSTHLTIVHICEYDCVDLFALTGF